MLNLLSPKRILKFSNSLNPFVKAFIISDSLLSAALNFVSPFFAVFLINDVPGGTVQIAASMISAHLIVRIFVEVVASKFINNLKERDKIMLVSFGMLLISVGYLGFGLSRTIFQLYLFSLATGIGWGISNPTKLSLFSSHLDKTHEVMEWSMTDVMNLIMVAFSVVIAGFIAGNYGFPNLFLLAGVLNFLSAFPYLYFAHVQSKNKHPVALD